MRLFLNKGSLLTLIWTFFPLAVSTSPILNHRVSPYYYGVCALCFPIAGGISDVLIGRYKIIRYSLWILWSSVIFFNVLLVLEAYEWESQVLKILQATAMSVILAGIAGSLANTIQFGIDQLVDAASSDIESYISWYTWTLSFSIAFVSLSQGCLCGLYYSAATSFFILPLAGTLAMISDLLLSKWFVKEPVLQNPFKLIYQVLKYAARNKYPRLRSAFTYWEDKPYSRIDLGKAKYGGPFTTEQVEDVKTFFRLICIIAASTPSSGLLYCAYNFYIHSPLFTNMDSRDRTCEDTLPHCYLRKLIQHAQSVAVVLFVPFFEVVLYPLFTKCSCFFRIKITHKIALGVLIILVYEVYMLVIEVGSSVVSYGNNGTCLFDKKDEQVIEEGKNYKWLILVLPQPLLAVAIYTLLSGSLEFVCAQSPYSMKGFLVGILYVMHGISVTLSMGLLQLLQRPLSKFGQMCTTWLYVCVISFTLLVAGIQILLIKMYTFRKRDDILRNDQMFAVNYFNKYLPTK